MVLWSYDLKGDDYSVRQREVEIPSRQTVSVFLREGHIRCVDTLPTLPSLYIGPRGTHIWYPLEDTKFLVCCQESVCVYPWYESCLRTHIGVRPPPSPVRLKTSRYGPSPSYQGTFLTSSLVSLVMHTQTMFVEYFVVLFWFVR